MVVGRRGGGGGTVTEGAGLSGSASAFSAASTSLISVATSAAGSSVSSKADSSDWKRRETGREDVALRELGVCGLAVITLKPSRSSVASQAEALSRTDAVAFFLRMEGTAGRLRLNCSKVEKVIKYYNDHTIRNAE